MKKYIEMDYPGHIIKMGTAVQPEIIGAIQQQLIAKGCGPLPVNGRYDTKTIAAVRLFQSRFPDATGAPLAVDGQKGPVSWAALFGTDAVAHKKEAANDLLMQVLDVARTQLGVLEAPPEAIKAQK